MFLFDSCFLSKSAHQTRRVMELNLILNRVVRASSELRRKTINIAPSWRRECWEIPRESYHHSSLLYSIHQLAKNRKEDPSDEAKKRKKKMMKKHHLFFFFPAFLLRRDNSLVHQRHAIVAILQRHRITSKARNLKRDLLLFRSIEWTRKRRGGGEGENKRK